MDAIADWINDGGGERSIYVLYGIAGVGTELDSRENDGRAGSREQNPWCHLFFSREEGNRKTARTFFPTFAYHLAQSYPEPAVHIHEILEGRSGRNTT